MIVEVAMPVQVSYTQAKKQFIDLWDEVVDNREIVIIKRRGAEDVALIAASELTGLLETCHLLRSPKNAERLLAAYEQAMKKENLRENF
jgi:antitoxin YefM